jgi:hypothetical protein
MSEEMQRSTDSDNMREKITETYSRQGAASKMFRDGGANEIFVNFPL